jgi:hypothetical protein
MLSYLKILSARICISIATTMPITTIHRARVERVGTSLIGASSREQYPMRVTGPHTQWWLKPRCLKSLLYGHQRKRNTFHRLYGRELVSRSGVTKNVAKQYPKVNRSKNKMGRVYTPTSRIISRADMLINSWVL